MGKAEFAAFLAPGDARHRERKMRAPIIAVRTGCAHADDHSPIVYISIGKTQTFQTSQKTKQDSKEQDFPNKTSDGFFCFVHLCFAWVFVSLREIPRRVDGLCFVFY